MKDSKKIDKRQLKKTKKTASLASQDVTLDTLLHFMEALKLDEEKKREFLSPIPTAKGRYVTSNATLDKKIDSKIFAETQIKRFLHWLTTDLPLLKYLFALLFVKLFGMKLAYFEQGEDKHPETMYKLDEAHHITDDTQGFTIHNLGHATQLIQTSGMTILTDPVFGNLFPILYPSMTKKLGYDPTPNQLPLIDVILISHNHRDHVDEASLRQLCEIAGEHQPQLLVPLGDKQFFSALGFKNVREFEWHEQITLRSTKTGQKVTFCSEPAEHRSGRGACDTHKSLVMGWSISPKDQKEILYFSGDTARLSDVRMKSLALDIYQLFQHKKDGLLDSSELPKIINMEPGGPNYTRQEMKPTHQSAVDSIVSAFRLATALESISNADQSSTNKITAKQWLEATATIFMHHNKYQLGPDRFNENVFIFNRLLSYLEMDEKSLSKQERIQKGKSKSWSLFHRRKDFIIDGVKELKKLAHAIWPDESTENQKTKLIGFIQSRIHFPLIRQKLRAEDAFQFGVGEKSTIVPDTRSAEKGNKGKGIKHYQEETNSSTMLKRY